MTDAYITTNAHKTVWIQCNVQVGNSALSMLQASYALVFCNEDLSLRLRCSLHHFSHEDPFDNLIVDPGAAFAIVDHASVLVDDGSKRRL